MAKNKARRLVIVPEAVEEIDDLHRFFEHIRSGLGDRFLDELGECFHEVLANPGRFQFVNSKAEGVRRGLLKQAPVVFLYRELDHELRILMVRDLRSNWKTEAP